MKTKIKFFLTTFVFSVAITFSANSQIAISNISEIAKIKSGTTYIAMKDPNSEKAKEYVNAFKNNWTISKFEFIKYSEIEKYISPENSFLTIGGYETSTQFIKLYENGSRKNGINYSNTHLYLELWTCNEKYFQSKKKKKEFGNSDKIQVARIELFTDFATLSDPDKLFQSDYDGNGHIRNWGSGILKNYIQSLISYLNKSENRTLYSGIFNSMEMKNLKKEVLYVPEYVLTKFNKFTGDETKKHDEKDLFEDYKLKYKLISLDELNQKILADKTSFYYLIYIKSSTDKYISVVNSLTGEIIYSTYSPVSYNIKSGDLKDLQKKTQ
ncbi:MAG: hypothetical protein IPL31_08625 [Saprospiraceae bacterium]|nr:hypothetical protein [Saprospiraceae bacterium]